MSEKKKPPERPWYGKREGNCNVIIRTGTKKECEEYSRRLADYFATLPKRDETEKAEADKRIEEARRQREEAKRRREQEEP